jgi:putative flavoprotein involved in K+ transport
MAMKRTGTLIIGAGQAGLAMSRCLSDRGEDHVILERGRVGERWRSERWESLKLLTPNWQSRLPGWSYQGDDPEGFMSMAEVVGYFEDYARSFDAPVIDETTVYSVTEAHDGFRSITDAGEWASKRIVVATGQCGVPQIPTMAGNTSNRVRQIHASQYRRSSALADGGVLVIGAGASGVQLADELNRAGRQVTLAVGSHSRLLRNYRGIDSMWWLDQMGVFDKSIDEMRDPAAAPMTPSLQIVGGTPPRDVNLPALEDSGIELVGRVESIDGTQFGFADDLAASTARADGSLRHLLGRIDEYISAKGFEPEVGEVPDLRSIAATGTRTGVDLRSAGIATVIWATGYGRSYPWLKVPVLDARSEIIHRKGITPVDGMYVLGLNFLSQRNSNFIDGVRHDAQRLAAHITSDADATACV